MSKRLDVDAVVVGASLAGCSTAMLLAQQGARVALVEQRADPQAFKKICGHYVQSSALPTIERLGLLEKLLEGGAVRSRFRMWTPSGLITPPGESAVAPGLNLRRERLDPIMRAAAAATPGVELLTGRAVDRLIADSGRACGVEAQDVGGGRVSIHARVVIGADGRDSRVAKLAGIDGRFGEHGRFSYAAYFRGPPPTGSPDATVWFLDPDWAAAFPTDDGLTLYACMPTKHRLSEFKGDLAGALTDFMARLPAAPPIRESERVAPVTGRVHMPNIRRAPVGRGLALVGDAAVATDPLWGVGCGWAIQTGEWLADALAPAMAGDETLERGLRRYRRRHRAGLLAHVLLIQDYAGGRRLRPPERLMFAAASRDPQLADRVGAFGTRNIGPARFLTPGTVGRALIGGARHWRGGNPEAYGSAFRGHHPPL